MNPLSMGGTPPARPSMVPPHLYGFQGRSPRGAAPFFPPHGPVPQPVVPTGVAGAPAIRGPPGPRGFPPPRAFVPRPVTPVSAVPRPFIRPVGYNAASAPPQASPSPTSALPAGWSEHFTPQGQRYFYNAGTGVSTYDRPTETANGGAGTSPALTTSATGTWVEYKDETSGNMYYFNTLTKVTTWDQPEEYRIQQARAQVEQIQKSTEAEKEAADEKAKRRELKRQQAEAKALEAFGTMTKEDRVAAFKQFLEEKEISPQFKWQEAQRFVTKEGWENDTRWKLALSTVGEKKQAFSEYCTQAVNKKSIEKRRRAKRVREEFLELLGSIENQLLRSRTSYSELAQGAEFYGLRKDPRWLAIEESKEKKDLFDGFVEELERKRTQIEAKQREDVKTQFVEKLKELAKTDSEHALFIGKRRLDSELKRKVWQIYEDIKSASTLGVSIHHHDVYDWTEEVLDFLKHEESEMWKAEREKRKEKELGMAKCIEDSIEPLIQSNKLTFKSSWKDFRAAFAEQMPEQNSNILSERRKKRIFDSALRRFRERLRPAADAITRLLHESEFFLLETTTYEEYAAAVVAGVTKRLQQQQGEQPTEPGDTESQEKPEEKMSKTKCNWDLELATLVKNHDGDVASIELPAVIRAVFQLLQMQSHNKKKGNRTRSSSSVSPSSKRRRLSSDASSRDRSRSRSRSRSRGRHNHTQSSTASSQLARPAPGPLDEAARAEEIIRLARLKIQAKQEAIQRGEVEESEPEEGEEMEEGEVSE